MNVRNAMYHILTGIPFDGKKAAEMGLVNEAVPKSQLRARTVELAKLLLGKNPNTDAERGKKTYPTFYGVDGAKKLADDCVTRAIGRLQSFGPSADPLREIARYITSRRN